jgi:hypothetical protein
VWRLQTSSSPMRKADVAPQFLPAHTGGVLGLNGRASTSSSKPPVHSPSTTLSCPRTGRVWAGGYPVWGHLRRPPCGGSHRGRWPGPRLSAAGGTPVAATMAAGQTGGPVVPAPLARTAGGWAGGRCGRQQRRHRGSPGVGSWEATSRPGSPGGIVRRRVTRTKRIAGNRTRAPARPSAPHPPGCLGRAPPRRLGHGVGRR